MKTLLLAALLSIQGFDIPEGMMIRVFLPAPYVVADGVFGSLPDDGGMLLELKDVRSPSGGVILDTIRRSPDDRAYWTVVPR